MLLHFKRIFPALTLGLLVSQFATQAYAGHASVVVDAATGRVLEADNADQLNYPASLTKMMTLYLTFEAIRDGKLKWDDRLVLSQNAESKDPYKFAVGAGKTISVKEAVLGMIVISANDAAVAIAEHMAGSEAVFGKIMTEKAHMLGMLDTVFTNPAGLPDPRQVTTANDMATLGLALMRDFPTDYKLFSTRHFVFRGMKLHGHNKVMARYPGADGIKTGYTEVSGYNLITSAKNGKKRVVGVVLGGKTGNARDEEMIALMEKYLGNAQSTAKND